MTSTLKVNLEAFTPDPNLTFIKNVCTRSSWSLNLAWNL